MEERVCQSCGFPVSDTEDILGKNADGTINKDYCKYCFDEGTFKMDCSMEELINLCAPHVASTSGMSEEDVRKSMQASYPKLKRWREKV